MPTNSPPFCQRRHRLASRHATPCPSKSCGRFPSLFDRLPHTCIVIPSRPLRYRHRARLASAALQSECHPPGPLTSSSRSAVVGVRSSSQARLIATSQTQTSIISRAPRQGLSPCHTNFHIRLVTGPSILETRVPRSAGTWRKGSQLIIITIHRVILSASLSLSPKVNILR